MFFHPISSTNRLMVLMGLTSLPAVESTINLGGHHGNSTYPRTLRRHLRSGGGSDFVVSIRQI